MLRYFDTLINGHKLYSLLSVLNEITLQKDLHKCMTNNSFGPKK